MDVPIGPLKLPDIEFKKTGLNPCFNGCANRPYENQRIRKFRNRLNPCFNGCANRPVYTFY